MCPVQSRAVLLRLFPLSAHVCPAGSPTATEMCVSRPVSSCFGRSRSVAEMCVSGSASGSATRSASECVCPARTRSNVCVLFGPCFEMCVSGSATRSAPKCVCPARSLGPRRNVCVPLGRAWSGLTGICVSRALPVCVPRVTRLDPPGQLALSVESICSSDGHARVLHREVCAQNFVGRASYEPRMPTRYVECDPVITALMCCENRLRL